MNIGEMTLADFARLEDIKKTVTVELHPGRQLNEETWTQHGVHTDTYYLTFTDGEVDRVEINGIEIDEEFSISDVNGNADSFYYDWRNQILYIHTTDSDNPATIVSSYPKYSIVAYFWIAVANRPEDIEIRSQLLINNIFNFWTTATNLEDWTESISGTSAITRDTSVYDDRIEAYAAKLTTGAGGDDVHLYQNINTRPQTKHKIKIRYKTDNALWIYLYDTVGNVYLNTSLRWVAGATPCLIFIDTSGEWATAEIEFVTHPDYEDYTFRILATAVSQTAYISRVEFWRYYQPLPVKNALSIGSIPAIQQSVGVYYFPENQISFGDIEINDDGTFISNRENYLWHNKEAIVKVGDLDRNYEDFPIFFYGYTRSPAYPSSGTFRFTVMDRRMELKRLPIGTFNPTDYPNVDTEWADRPVPILLGGCTDYPLLPVCIDTTTYEYQISETTFNGTSYDLYAIVSVHKDGKQLTITTDYTVDLPNAQFTLVADPLDSEIICYAQGLETSPFGNGYSVYPADALFFILCIANNISKQRLNWASFVDLNANRVLGYSLFIDEEIDSIELIDQLQQTAVFQMFIRLDGTIEARRYTSDVPSDAPSFRNSDFAYWEIIEDTEHCYRELAAKYDYNNVSKIYEDEVNEDSHVAGITGVRPALAEYEHGVKSKLTIEMLATVQAQVENLWDNYMKMIQQPMEMLVGKLNVPEAMLLNPTDKIKIYLEREIDDELHVICNNETFQIMSITKNIADCSADIVAFKGVSTFYWTM